MQNQVFEDLTNFKIFFGHLILNEKFKFNDNYYQKIGLYVTSKGKKINAVKLKFFDTYFSLSDIDNINKADFCYIEDNTFLTTRNYTSLGKAPTFIEDLPLKVPGNYIDFPIMLDVIDCLFQKKYLSTLVTECVEKYKNFLLVANDPIPPAYTIREVQEKLIEKIIQENRIQIMLEIESDVARYRLDLIKKRLRD